jgi:hypothetical protein
LRSGPRGFRPGFPCPAVLRNSRSEAVQFRLRGRYPLRRAVPCASPTTQLCNSPTRRQADQLEPYNPPITTAAAYHVMRVWAVPFSLATTQGVEISFLSSGYLDVSVPQLASLRPMYSAWGTRALPRVSFLIRRSRGQRSVSTSPGLIAAAHVLLRLLAPRHPPCALILLIVKNITLCRYGVFKVHADKARLTKRKAGKAPVSQNSTANGLRLQSPRSVTSRPQQSRSTLI